MADDKNRNDDPHLWLEDVQGDKALAWVRERNAETVKQLAEREDFAPTRTRLLEVLNSKDRIPTVARRGEWLYNFWQDGTHKRGLWRRTTLAEYRRPAPRWETVLDLDALAAAEKENWVWGGAECLGPDYRRCLVSLSRGGADAKVIREFDTVAKRFVDAGFVLPEAKSDVAWGDADTLYVGTDFGPGSMTDSGYPRIVKRWKRGTPLAEAKTVFEGRREDVWVGVSVDHTPGFERTLIVRALDFYRQETLLLQGDRLAKLDVPEDARLSFMHSAGLAGDTLLLELRSDLRAGERVHPRGSLLAADFAAYQKGERRFQVLFEPTETRSLAGTALTRSHVLVNVNDNVIGRLEEWKREADGRFTGRVVDAPSPGNLGVTGLHDPMRSDDPLAESYLLSYADFLTPDSLLLGRTGSDRRDTLKMLPASFDGSDMRTEQRFATSRDGTRVPYFVVWPRGARADGTNPTLLYGYGGFQVSLEPWYSRAFGAAWYPRGGVLVVANIRGGGEFGPRWHQAALKANKQRSYDDFIAVAEDLIRHRITSARHLGIEGGSNGGLLVGAVMLQRPELFNAVVSQVPLLDMRRYHKLLAGASWMAEYGNPDVPEDWAAISRYSPYQNVRRDGRYPTPLFTTSTRDDRVHPGHARKMVARLREYGHPVLYYENIEGGHGGAADNEQRATLQAIEFTYLWQRLARAD
ncbi:prolyl oligopeptidase family serine peptidase [uncultured Piscinibacter sp.]|uniref:prolyl oligopeptidase family serine peptidase n=1 Tax=uncultured Piscinibacter sp. TaxID=1131835 RepID=UPI00260FB179|nr:prolyl oligopeptidase family serine peptidase [uncultured Piscinibacter sp.]